MFVKCVEIDNPFEDTINRDWQKWKVQMVIKTVSALLL